MKVIILLDEYDTPMQEALRQIEEKNYQAVSLQRESRKAVSANMVLLFVEKSTHRQQSRHLMF